ncbi:hypothetical protein Ndes2526B_g00104 [Nannochloris sp. 'desiccata']
MLVVSASAACSMVKYPRQFIKPARNEDGQWLFASYAQTRVDAGISIKTCLNKCKKDSKCKVVKIDNKHLFPGFQCRPNGCTPKLYCEYYSQSPVATDGNANFDVTLALQEQYSWAEKRC